MLVFKHPITADVDPDMPLLPYIHGFEGVPTFSPEIAIFSNGALMIFPKSSRKSQYLM